MANDFLFYPDPFDITVTLEGGLLDFRFGGTEFSEEMELIGGLVSSTVHSDSEFDMDMTLSGSVTYDYIYKNTFRWADIGSKNFVPDRQNVAGFKTLEWDGTPYGAFRCGKYIVVLGAGGISLMAPVSDPVSAYSEKVLQKPGILSKYACTGDNRDSVYFVDSLYRFCVLQSKNDVTKAFPEMTVLDYSEFVKSLTGEIILSMDSTKDVCYISGSNKTLVFNPKAGMTILNRPVQTIMNLKGVLRLPSFVQTNQTYLLLFHDADFGNPELKTLQMVGFDINAYDMVNPRCLIYIQGNSSSAWKLIKSFKVSPDGIAFPNVTAAQFRIGLAFEKTSSNPIQVDSTTCIVQFSDRRGVYISGGSASAKQTST